jgi:hypothetical protein
MEDAIFVASAFILILVGNLLLKTYKRLNRRATLTRHRSQRRGGGPSNAGDTGAGYDERDQGGDSGSGDWGSDGGSGDSGGGGSD